jgi:hypothetical protein
MATTLQLDTLEYAKKLKTAGVPAEQAEAQAAALGEALAHSVAFRGDLVSLESNLSTKTANMESRLQSNVEGVESRLQSKIEGVESRLESKIEGVESRLESKIEGVESRLVSKIEAVKLELRGKLDALRWMFGVLVALNGGILIRLLVIH